MYSSSLDRVFYNVVRGCWVEGDSVSSSTCSKANQVVPICVGVPDPTTTSTTTTTYPFIGKYTYQLGTAGAIDSAASCPVGSIPLAKTSLGDQHDLECLYAAAFQLKLPVRSVNTLVSPPLNNASLSSPVTV